MPDLDALARMADDPTLTPYRDPATGTISFFKQGADPEKLKAKGFEPATPEDVARRASLLQHTTMLGQIASAGKLAARTATFGQTFNSPEDNQQIKDFSTVSPTLSTLTKVVGAAAPAVLGAVAAPEALGALGLSARAAQIGTTVAEEAAGNSAFEIEDAKEQNRGISLANIAVGMGLGAGLSTVGRYARGALRRAPEDLLGKAGQESNTFSRGARLSEERRSVGAAGAEDVKRPPATTAEVEDYAHNAEQRHAEVNQVAHDALADAFTGHEGVTGQSGGAARQVHGLAFKEQDVIPHMTDVDPEPALNAVYEHASEAMKTAETLRAAGQNLAAKRLQQAAEAALNGLQDASETEYAAKGAVGLNRLKQEADDILGTYLRNKSVTAKSAAKEISGFVEPLRQSLEDSDTWGSFWADRQKGENALWSGDNGIIQLSNIWQPEVFETVKGKARVAVGDALSEVSNRTPRADVAEHIMGLPPIKARKVLDAWESTLDQWDRMTALKEESGLVRPELSSGESPVDVLKQSLQQQRQMIEELRFLRDAGPRAKFLTQKLAAEGAVKAQGELLFEGAKHLPGVGHLLKAADHAAEATTGRSIADRLFKPQILPPAEDITREGALSAISARQEARAGRVPETPPRGPGGGPAFGGPKGGAPVQSPGGLGPVKGGDVRGVGLGGELGDTQRPVGHARVNGKSPVDLSEKTAAVALAGTAAITGVLGRISDNSKKIQERAALGLVVKESRAPKLPPLATRFRGDAPDLASAFRSTVADLKTASDDPQAFVNGMADTYGAMAGDHGHLYQQLVARVQIGTQYLLANLPPSVGISMARPSGIEPDAIAVMKFAAMHDAVFSPGNVVYDVGTGDATPTQLKALREVHPDIYGELRAQVLMQIAQVGQKIPFETLRGLDNLFDVPGVAGPAFSPGMTATMAQAYAQKAPAGNPSLKGESSIASATDKFSKGPSQLA